MVRGIGSHRGLLPWVDRSAVDGRGDLQPAEEVADLGGRAREVVGVQAGVEVVRALGLVHDVLGRGRQDVGEPLVDGFRACTTLSRSAVPLLMASASSPSAAAAAGARYASSLSTTPRSALSRWR
jgi:hypothetical protein